MSASAAEITESIDLIGLHLIQYIVFTNKYKTVWKEGKYMIRKKRNLVFQADNLAVWYQWENDRGGSLSNNVTHTDDVTTKLCMYIK